MNINYTVSVRLMTFNHAPFIREAIESILMQKTNFFVEVVVGDDFSTDSTLDILKQYESTDNIHIKILNRKKGDEYWFKRQERGRLYNFQNILENCTGKYVALLDGDDYWIDPLKLQKQVDFLEENPEFGLCHGNCHFFYDNTEKWQKNANKELSNNTIIKGRKELFYYLLDGSYKIRTATVLFKRELLNKIKPNTQTFLMGDTPLWLDLSQLTKFKYFDDVFSVYRISSESASNSKNKIKKLRFKMSMAEMRLYYCQKYDYIVNTNLKERYNSSLITLKIFDNEYQSKHSLINPTKQEKFIYNYSSNMVVRILFKLKIRSAKYINLIGRKINIVS